ncbi:porin [Luteimonas fraxinea]|uniref:OprO/OprP family phosphate-selective porin n=1 Tax=Luteimonas fraxinea TaxID=2901869 RepID=UPI001E42DE31|nr:porin [Luteimonas fraxinea]UHH11444.1 porin [Luteimonas fraxinea]
MNRTHTRALAAGALLGLATLPAFAADTATETELRELIRLQAEQIQQQSAQLQALNQRLDAMGAPAVAAAPATAPVDGVQAQIDAAVADTRQDDMAILQAQVAQLAASGGTGGGGGNVSWRRGGPEFRNSDRSFTFNPRGRVLVDFSSTHGSDFDTRNITGTNLRQARLGAQGTIGALGYKIDAELSDNTVSLSDAYLSWDTMLGSIPTEFYVGNKLKDRAIDSSTTLTRTPFMERNAVASVGMPASGYFGLGVQMKMIGQNWHTTFGVTGDDVGNTGTETDSLTYSFRGHVNPIKRPSGFLHVGGWYVHEDYGVDTNRINRTPRVASRFNDNVRVSASAINDVTGEKVWGAELGGTWRNVWAFAETSETTLRSTSVGEVDQKAHSAYAGWLITGEKPGFSARSGVWGTTRVARPVTDGGIGAWELATRYDKYDFTDAARGGEGDSWTLGLNWYLNNWSRVMFNYVRWNTDNQVGAYAGMDSGNTFNIRTQVVF